MKGVRKIKLEKTQRGTECWELIELEVNELRERMRVAWLVVVILGWRLFVFGKRPRAATLEAALL